MKPLPQAHLFISLFDVVGVGSPKVSLKLSVFCPVGQAKAHFTRSWSQIAATSQSLNELKGSQIEATAQILKPACWVKPKPLLKPKASGSHGVHKPRAHKYVARGSRQEEAEPLIADAITLCNVTIDTLLVGKMFVDSDGDVANEFWEEATDGELKRSQQVTAIPDLYDNTIISRSDHASMQASMFCIAIDLLGPR